MIFDTHAHYDDEAFDDDREKLLERMQNRGVEYIVNVGASMSSCKSTIGLVRRFPYVYGALGVHPDERLMLHKHMENVSQDLLCFYMMTYLRLRLRYILHLCFAFSLITFLCHHRMLHRHNVHVYQKSYFLRFSRFRFH